MILKKKCIVKTKRKESTVMATKKRKKRKSCGINECKEIKFIEK